MEPLLSIIIPTKNEEQYLPLLLESIKKQASWVEIIVADNNSTDKTVEIAKQYNAKIVKGGSPESGRNNGARIASTEYLLFLDADCILPPGFLKDNFSEFKQRRKECATTYLAPLTKNGFDHFIYGYFWNWFYFFSHKFSPYAAGFCIFSTKQYFHKKGGFSLHLIAGSSRAYVRKSEFGLLHGPKVFVSTRQFQKELRLMFLFKKCAGFVHQVFFGDIKKPFLFFTK